MDNASEFEVDKMRFEEVAKQFDKITSPDVNSVQLEDLRDQFAWERGRFVQIDGYVQSGFDLHARMFENLVSEIYLVQKSLAEIREKSTDVRIAQLKGHVQQLEQIEDTVTELIATNPPPA